MTPMPKLDNDTLLLAFVGVTALAIVLQTIILLAIFTAICKAARSVKDEVDDLRSSMMPIIHSSRDLLARLSPKIEATVDDLSGIARGLRIQTAEVQSSAFEIMDKLRRQTSRVDRMFTTVLDAVDRAGGFVAETVSLPMRKISGLLSSIKAIIESLRMPPPEPRPTHSASDRPASDRDMFV
jgi:phage-related protein